MGASGRYPSGNIKRTVDYRDTALEGKVIPADLWGSWAIMVFEAMGLQRMFIQAKMRGLWIEPQGSLTFGDERNKGFSHRGKEGGKPRVYGVKGARRRKLLGEEGVKSSKNRQEHCFMGPREATAAHKGPIQKIMAQNRHWLPPPNQCHDST